MKTSLLQSKYSIKVAMTRALLFTCFIVNANLTLNAQQDVNIAILKLMNGSVKGGSRIIEFKPSTLIIRVKMKGVSQYVEQEIPASEIKDIYIWYDFRHAKGVLPGLLWGTGLGTAAGVSFLYFIGPVGAIAVIGTAATAGTLIGWAIGSQKKKKFKINGGMEEYQKHQAEMQELLTKK